MINVNVNFTFEFSVICVFVFQAMAKESAECPPEPMGSEEMLFMLYTSGSTGKPKGIVHTQAGYLLYASLTHQVGTDFMCRTSSLCLRVVCLLMQTSARWFLCVHEKNKHVMIRYQYFLSVQVINMFVFT